VDFFPKAYDIAATLLDVDNAFHDISIVARDTLITKKTVTEREIGPGDDVFMVGRFVDHDGGETNVPAIRFGHISMPATPIEQLTGATLDSWVIDVHSQTGIFGIACFCV
jgi:hypothetical protein